MKNPFIAAAVAMAAMASQARQRVIDQFAAAHGHDPIIGRRTRSRIAGGRNPAGAKTVRRFYRNKHGYKTDYPTARQWYRGLKES